VYFFHPGEDVKKEMINEKRLDEANADKIGEYVRFSDGLELVDQLMQDKNLKNIKSAVEGLEAKE
jgi:hypothetical protein